MVDLKLLEDIEKYLSTLEGEEDKLKAAKVRKFIVDLIDGKNVEADLKELFKNDENIRFFRSTNSMSDAELLLAVLNNCDESVLIELENSFGKNSRLTKIIREQVRHIPRAIYDEEQTIQRLEHMIAESEKSGNELYMLLCKYMMEKGFETDADFYNHIMMPRQNFARIRDKRNTLGKHSILWIIVGLKLNYYQAEGVLKTAGYAFKKDDKRDAIISYIIKNVANYDLDMVNDVLYHFGLKTFFEEK
ncbi:MAG: hypothetical protein J1F63_01465 [Oscillospiraceae bacterium]|nr:hypothetical protein [Oscillospiraceae bacterium]